MYRYSVESQFSLKKTKQNKNKERTCGNESPLSNTSLMFCGEETHTSLSYVFHLSEFHACEEVIGANFAKALF